MSKLIGGPKDGLEMDGIDGDIFRFPEKNCEESFHIHYYKRNASDDFIYTGVLTITGEGETWKPAAELEGEAE